MSILTFAKGSWFRILIFIYDIWCDDITKHLYYIFHLSSVPYCLGIYITNWNFIISLSSSFWPISRFSWLLKFYISSRDSSRVFVSILESFCLSAPFLFRGFLSLEPIGLPCFKCVVDLLVTLSLDRPYGISIRVRAFAASIYDLVTIFISVNVFVNWFIMACKCTIRYTLNHMPWDFLF